MGSLSEQGFLGRRLRARPAASGPGLAVDVEVRESELTEELPRGAAREAEIRDVNGLPAYQSFVDTAQMLTDQQREVFGALDHGDGYVTILVTAAGNNQVAALRGFRTQLETRWRIRTKVTVSISVLNSLARHEPLAGAATGKRVESGSPQQLALEIFNEAIECDASDIHIEIRDSSSECAARVRFRVDGDLSTVRSVEDRSGVALYSKAVNAMFQSNWTDDKSRSNSQGSTDVYQSARLEVKDVRNLALRYQTLKDKDGHDCILRLLTYDDKKTSLISLEQMGFEPDQVGMLVSAVEADYGISLLGGSTGSGKTTTLAGIMAADRNGSLRKRVSCEDPVEIDMPDVTQAPVQRSGNDSSTKPFLEVLKAVLRGDPDVVIIGEVRERATAEVMIDMALTGHNAFATIHINSMFEAFTRLTNETIGVAKDVLGSSNLLNLVDSQTLVPKLCPHCKVPFADTAAKGLVGDEFVRSLDTLGVDPNGMFFENNGGYFGINGCEHCGGRGRKGRTVCAEMMLVDDDTKLAITKGDFRECEEIYRKSRRTLLTESGMQGKTILDHVILRAFRGEVSAHYINKVGTQGLEREVARRRARGWLEVRR